jgi:hypothetical protein
VNEATFWKTVVRPLLLRATRGHRVHMERVENAVANGTPDVDFCINGVSGKLELKWGVRRASPQAAVLGKRRGMRRSQVVWAMRRVRAGGRVFVVVGCPQHVWVLDARTMTKEQLMEVGVYGRDQLDEVAKWRSGGTPPHLLGVLLR